MEQYRLPLSKDTPLHQLISRRVKEIPDKTAVSLGDKKITYKSLNSQANQLAAILVKNNVKKGDKVAFALDRSAEMLISLLAIMKTGAVYISRSTRNSRLTVLITCWRIRRR